jgi:cellulose synthase/poly-beta-1,6-N-acetylglucosamine synthase-like glycosyltransferase
VPLSSSAPAASGRLPAEVPVAETRGRKVTVRLVTVVAVLATMAYLFWRAAATLDLSVWWIAVPLLLLEVHALICLVLYAAPLWDLDAMRPPAPVDEYPGALAVLIPTYNESLEVLLPTVAAAVSAELPHQTWVLDDSDRPEVARLAAALGARYLARSEHDHAKAGNVNHALQYVDADIVVLLDADHVASRDLLRNTLGYFDDPLVALVQTPQDFYNDDSFEHHRSRGGRVAKRYSEQEMFYRGLQPGRNRFNAAFMCGTGAVVRVQALREVGGLAVETVTEDIHTTIRMHRAGWKTRYHNEVLARGLAAANAAQYMEQRVRWGTGAMQVLRRENPAFVSGLTFMQRVGYLGTLLGWFDSWRSLGYVLAPMVVLLSGAVPVRADLPTFLAAFGGAFLLQRLALRLLSRGLAPQGIVTVFELVRMPATLRATTRVLSSRERGFTVTDKGRTADIRGRIPVPPLLTGLLVASVVAAAWFGATLLGMTPVTYEVPWAAYGALGWLVVNAALLALAIRRIRDVRYGAERRAAVRFDVTGTAALDGLAGRLLDASPTGALLTLGAAAPATGDRVVLDVEAGNQQLHLAAVVRSARAGDTGQTLIGLEFTDGQIRQKAALALALFRTGAVPQFVERTEERAA